ncbi:hypothetical protein Tco_0739617 [Tanacetum coccineum]
MKGFRLPFFSPVDLIFSLTLLKAFMIEFIFFKGDVVGGGCCTSVMVDGDAQNDPLSMIQELDNARLHELNSEPAFQAQLKLRDVSYLTKRIPFCIVSDGSCDFPPGRSGVLVAALSSKWAEIVVNGLDRQWNWTDNANGTLRL